MTKSNKRYIIDVAVILFLMIGFGVIMPPVAPVTPVGMKMIGILAGCIYGWIRGWLIWTSLLGIIITGFVTGMGATGALTSGFGNETALIIIASYFLCAALAKTDLLDVIAKFILSRKFARKSPWMLALAMFITAYITSALVTTIVSCILLWSLLVKLRDLMGLEKTNPYIHFLTCGVAICAYCGWTTVPWNAMVLIASALMGAMDPTFTVNYMSYTMVGLILGVVTILSLILVGKFIVCPKVNVMIPEGLISGEIVIGRKQIVAIVSLVFTVTMLFAPSVAGSETLLYRFSTTLGTSGTMIVAAIFMQLVRINETSIADMLDSIRSNEFGWGTVFLVMAALVVAGQLTAPATGISEALKTVLAPIFGGKSLLVFIALLCIICIVTTNMFNNAVMLTLLLPICVIFAPEYGVSNQFVVTIMSLLLAHGLVMPSGSIVGSALHAQSQLLTSGQAIKYAVIGEIAFCAVAIFVSCILVTLGLFC